VIGDSQPRRRTTKPEPAQRFIKEIPRQQNISRITSLYHRQEKQENKASNMSAQIKHQTLGEIQGRQGDGVIQFLGIKYASLKDRFAGSELVEYGETQGVIDGTQLGYVTFFESRAPSD
jgi:hypothetical protein